MINESSSIVKIIVSVLLFPLFFQTGFITFAWGATDPLWLLIGKRIFLLLPVFAFIGACWLSIASIISVIVRPRRQEFVTALFITWWDLGKAIVAFWGGIFSFIFNLAASLLGLLKTLFFGLGAMLQDILFMPFRFARNLGRSIAGSQQPWIAVFLTLLWCFIEVFIFTYVTSPLVIDTFSNITGDQLSETFVRIPLFAFLMVIILGSYAVLSTLIDAAQNKNVGQIIGIGVIEVIVLFVEVLFLYREFVDSLVPWLAQYSENFELGMVGVLAISGFMWFGVRSLSWILFAAHGTPTIMAIIQGKGLQGVKHHNEHRNEDLRKDPPKNFTLQLMSNFVERLKDDINWIQEAGERVLASFMLPPLQVLAAVINFCMLLTTGTHLFDIPFKNMDEITASRMLLKSISQKQPKSRNISRESETFHDA